MDKKCLSCHVNYSRNREKEGVNQWRKRKYCSHQCYWDSLNGRKSSRDKRVRKSCLFCKKDFLTKQSLLRVEYCSISCAKKHWWNKEENKKSHPIWKGGITKENDKIRKSSEYKEWRLAVLRRDRFTCVKCGHIGSKSYAHGDGECDLRADHIKPFSLYSDLRFVVSNGRDRKSTRLNSSHIPLSRMPSSA